MGGYPAHRAHLVEGRPGSGKTTLGLQFLLEGMARGDRCLYVTLKKRTGWHEDTIREFAIDGRGLRVGTARREFRGILTCPDFQRGHGSLLNDRGGHEGR
jgi:KaiC/GvpD/RAD55 family RecA-like ATPase